MFHFNPKIFNFNLKKGNGDGKSEKQHKRDGKLFRPLQRFVSTGRWKFDFFLHRNSIVRRRGLRFLSGNQKGEGEEEPGYCEMWNTAFSISVLLCFAFEPLIYFYTRVNHLFWELENWSIRGLEQI
jgi:hypothetical protein